MRSQCAGAARRRILETDDPEAYARVLDGAREDVLVMIAARRGLVPAATADDRVVVEDRDIPHQWIATLGTGYIDQRFVRRVTALLFRFEKKAVELGIRI